jgi:AhpD family alkylhydroperoxidase
MKGAAMDEKTKELVAIGSSVSAHCQPCLEFHASKARQAGASEDEIAEAIEIGKMVSKGAGVQMQKFIIKLAGGEDHTSDQSACRL